MSDSARHQQIQDRVEKATPGPWHQGPHYKSDVESPTGRVTECGTLRGERAKKDAAFIAHARSDVPWLLSELGRIKSTLSGVLDGNISPEEARYAIQGCEGSQCAVAAMERSEQGTIERDKT